MLKDHPQGQTNYYLSKCCHAQVDSVPTRDSAPEGQVSYNCQCLNCGELCDITTANELSKK